MTRWPNIKAWQRLADRFARSRAQLPAHTPSPGEHRYEIKFTCGAEEAARIHSLVRLLPGAFRQTYPRRLVSSIYFDSHSWGNLDENLAGYAERSKLRLRWYGADHHAAVATLELKEKNGMLGRKLNCRIDPPLDLESMSWTQLQDVIARADLGPLAPAVTRFPVPTILIAYDRDYYATADDRVRLTVDLAPVAYDQGLTSAPNLTIRTPHVEEIIVELKAPEEFAAELSGIAAAMPLQPVAHSKYAAGLLTALAR